jgi:hypothetical protein
MATLWEAVDAQRTNRAQSWDEVREATRNSHVESIRLETYGIAMHGAMNVVRWLGQPAATFMYAAERSPARPGSAAYGGAESAEAESSAPNLHQIYLRATRGKTDQEIVDFARSRGGFPSICRTLMLWLRATVTAGDLEVAMDLGDEAPWTFRSSNGRNSFQYRVKRSASSVLHASPADFMRLVFQDLDPDAACASGRVQVHGDSEHVTRLFRSLSAHA